MSTITQPSQTGSAPSDNEHRAARAVATLVGAAAGIFALGLLLGFAFVGRKGGGLIQGWDNRVETWEVHHRMGLVGVSKVVAFVGDAPKLAVVAALLSGIWWIATRSIRALIPLAAYLGGEFQVFVIREIIHRHRPPTANYPAPGAVPGVHETSYSFPSGHSVAVTAILFAITATICFSRRQWWPLVIAAIVSLFVIDTRLLLGVHWFSDVTFGLVLGAIWGIVVARVGQSLEWTDLRRWLPSRLAGSSRTPSSSPAKGA
jgi:membrane-associated phospholipid phosphatase